MKNTKKALSPVVATALLIVVSVVAVVGYQNWYGSYQSVLSADVETRSSSSGSINIDYIGTDGILYVTNTGNTNVSMDNVKVDGNNCNITTDLEPGTNKLNISGCLSTGVVNDIVIGTNGGLINEELYIGQDVYSYTPPPPPLFNGVYSLTYKYFNGLHMATASAISGNYFYTSGQNGGSPDGYLSIYDISIPTNIIQKDYYWNGAIGNGKEIVVNGNYAYLFGTSSFTTFDVSNKDNIVMLDNHLSANLNGAAGGKVIGNLAYFAGSDKVTLLNVSNPSNVVELGNFANATSMTGLRGLAVEGNYVYVGMHQRLTVLDVSNPSSIVQAGTYYNAGMSSGGTLEVSNGVVYFGANSNFFTLNVSNPSSITLLDQYTNGNLGLTDDVYLDGNVAYLSARSNDYVFAMDISDPSNLVYLDSIKTSNYNDPKVISKSGNHLFIPSYQNDGIIVIDATNNSDLIDVNFYGNLDTINPADFLFYDNIAYILAGNQLFNFDISDLNAEPNVNSFLDAAFSWAADLQMYNGVLYTASAGVGSFTSLNPSNPASITVRHTLSGGNLVQPREFEISGNLAFVMVNNGIVVVDISNPDSMSELAFYSNTNITGTSHAQIVGNVLYLSSYLTDSVIALNISDYNNIAQLDQFIHATNLDSVYEFEIVGDLLYASATTPDRLTILNISNPSNIIQVSSTNSASFDGIRGLYIVGDTAYAGIYNGMVSINISNPLSPTPIQSFSDSEIIGYSSFVNLYRVGTKLYASSLGKPAVYVFELE